MSAPVRIALSVGLIVLFAVAVEYLVSWHAVFRAWREVPLAHALAAFALMTLSHACRGARLWAYLRDSHRLRYVDALRVTLVHNLFNHVLPFRTGEATFPLLLNRRHAVPLATGIAALIWFRVIDIVFILAAGGLAIAAAGRGSTRWLALLPLVAVVPLAMAGLRARIAEVLAKAPQRRVFTAMRALVNGVPDNDRRLWVDAAWTAAGWTSKLCSLGVLLVAFTAIGPAQAVLAALGGELTSVLPLHTPAGVGTYEAGLVAAMAYAQISPERALSAAVNVHLALLAVALLYGVVALAAPRTEISAAPRTPGSLPPRL